MDNANAKGIISKSDQYGGTFAHRDIAFEFTTWISFEFNPTAQGNIRVVATLEQLVGLSNLESINAMLIHQGLKQSKRLHHLNNISII